MLTDVETAQACAEYCASSKEGLFWTFNNPRFYSGWTNCQVFSSIDGRSSSSGGCGVSGSRECGLFTMGGSKSLSLKAKRVVEHQIVKNCTHLPVHSQCTDNSTLESGRNIPNGQICLHSQCNESPWGALDFGNQTQVDRVEIRNTNYGLRVRDFEVWVTDSLPQSADKMFREGTLLASFVGNPGATEKITIEFPSSKPQPEGRYVLLQSKSPFKVDIEAFGGTTAFGACSKSELAPLALLITLLVIPEKIVTIN